ncbi:unnamed protein product [Prunus armeniaca]
MEMTTTSSAQGDEKYVAPSGNQKRAKTGVGHLIVRGMDFSGGGDQPRGVSKISLIILLWNAKRPILVSLASQLGFWIKKIGGGGWCLAGSVTMLTIRS